MAYLVRTIPALAVSAVCSIQALTVSSSSALAITINSTVAQSGFNGFSSTPFPLTNSDFPYDFDGQASGSLASIDSLRVTLTVFDGDTAPDEFDFNDLTLGLDGFNTGIALNGFSSNSLVTQAITGTPSNSAAILAALQTDGQLVGTVIDADPSEINADPGENGIDFPESFNTTLAVTGTAVPFEFSPGVGILALGALGAMAQLKSKMKNRKPLQLGSLSSNNG